MTRLPVPVKDIPVRALKRRHMKNSIYLKIYEDMRKSIVEGAYKAGEKIPSKRVCAENYGVSVISVEHAYELLLEEGYIVSKEKSGYFAAFDDVGADLFGGIEESGRNQERSSTPAVSSSGLTPTDADVFPGALYARRARQVLSAYPDVILRKSPNFGTEYLRDTLSKYLARSRHMSASPDNIIVGAGAEYLYGLIFQTLGKKRIYGIEEPSYYRIEQIYESLGADIRRLKLAKNGIKSDALAQTDANTIHITPYRSYPSGVTASASKKREYLKWAGEKGGIIIEDDFESEFTPSRKPEDTLFSLDDRGLVIYVNTFTRTISPSIRIAYMVVPDTLIGVFKENIGFYSCTVSTFEQYILAEIIAGGDFERHINRVRRAHRRKN